MLGPCCPIKSIQANGDSSFISLTFKSMQHSNDHVQTGQKRPAALQIGPRKKPYVRISLQNDLPLLNIYPIGVSCATDPLVHHGRHFGHTVHVLCTVSTLLNNGILQMGELADHAEETFTQEYVSRSMYLF
jgi:hypothetical protein